MYLSRISRPGAPAHSDSSSPALITTGSILLQCMHALTHASGNIWGRLEANLALIWIDATLSAHELACRCFDTGQDIS